MLNSDLYVAETMVREWVEAQKRYGLLHYPACQAMEAGQARLVILGCRALRQAGRQLVILGERLQRASQEQLPASSRIR
jgi:hypothetical protein